MQLVLDEIDGALFLEAVLAPSELKRLEKKEMIEGQFIHKNRKWYFSTRLQGFWDYNDDIEQEE